MAKKTTKKTQRKNKNNDEFEYDNRKIKGSLGLKMSKAFKPKFEKIKNFGNFDQWFFHKSFHLYYSLGVCYGALNFLESETDISKKEYDEKNFFEGEEMEENNSINSEQLRYYDDLFRIIAYWFLLKKGDSQPFRVLKDINLSRRICESIFFENFNQFFEIISDFDSENPNLDVCSLIFDSSTIKEHLDLEDSEDL